MQLAAGSLTLVMVVVAQLDRALDCGSEGRGFESPLSPYFSRSSSCLAGKALLRNRPKNPGVERLASGAVRVAILLGVGCRYER